MLKHDNEWPIKPHLSEARLPHNTELRPSRARAVARLSALAALAESHLLPVDEDGVPALLPDDRPYRSPEGFVSVLLGDWLSSLPGGFHGPDLDALRAAAVEAHKAWSAPDPKTLAGLSPSEKKAAGRPPEIESGGRLLLRWAREGSASSHVLLFQPRATAVLHPIRGDIVVGHPHRAGAHCGIVTVPQCSGCGHCEVVSFTPRGDALPPSVISRVGWLTNIDYIVRLVVPEPDAAAKPAAVAAPKPAEKPAAKAKS